VLRVAAVLVLLITACSSSGTDSTAPPTSTATTTTPPTPTTLDSATVSPCLEGDAEFGDEGIVASVGVNSGDARGIADLRWAAHAGCERFVVDLATVDGAPAIAVGETSVALVEPGILRIQLPETVTLTAVADNTFDGDLIQRAYVVRDRAGPLFVDLLLSGAIEARASALESPARVIVDAKPRSGEPGGTPTIGENVVVTSPQAGEAGYPLQVAGYSRTFEANVVARIRGGGEEIVLFTTATDYLETWGVFEMEFGEGPLGQVELFVGEDDAADGSERGVTIPLTML
jgi:hypothetical protein